MTNVLEIHGGQAYPFGDCPIVDVNEFRDTVADEIRRGARLSALCGMPGEKEDTPLLLAVLARDGEGTLALLATRPGSSYPSLTPLCPEAHLFEREIAETWGIVPEGHPWLKPVRGKTDGALPQFFAMTGEEVHEVAVGPVHAGIIEPGHFRFQCHGETVHHLEISLGYQHRGVERALVGGTTPRTIHYMETAAGDTTISHATAYCLAIESLAKSNVPLRAQALRVIAAELERMANHIGDLGAIAGDIGFLPTQAYCGRIRGDVLNCTALICGNRFGRGLVSPGGVRWDIDAQIAETLRSRLAEVEKHTRQAVELMFGTSTALARLEGTGTLTRHLAREIGLVGVAARAAGLERDVRHDHPYGLYRFHQLPVCTWNTGDCFARAYVRWLEIGQSIRFILEQIDTLPQRPISAPVGALRPDAITVSLTEGWRGEVCHVARTDGEGRFALYKIVDPSFHNWFGLACALRSQAISDFPLCNKSFNLSYCGHDL